MGAFYRALVADFLTSDPARLMLELTAGTAGLGFDLMPDQHSAWMTQTDILLASLRAVVERHPGAAAWGLLLEYQIPGRPRRIDAVLVAGHGIIVLEFKIGANRYLSGDKWQLLEYCWDLRDFHRESEGIPLAPILIATAAPAVPQPTPLAFDDRRGLVLTLLTANPSTLASALIVADTRLAETGVHSMDLVRWDTSQIHTTRNVIEEAQRLFGAHDAREVSHAHADNTTEAHDALLRIVSQSRAGGLRSICFLTGVPGAGKTLVGLHAAYSPAMVAAAGTSACFASGNQPLLDVLQAALTANRSRSKQHRREIGHDLSAPVQNVHDFALRNLLDPGQRPPAEQVVIFDEAQRVWSADKLAEGIKKRVQRRRLSAEQGEQLLSSAPSEPDLLLRVMERCPGWCVIVALIGGGQEIHEGEAGLGAWGQALERSGGRWTAWVAPEALAGGASVAGQTLFPRGVPSAVAVQPEIGLHLSVAKRSPRAERYAEWVNHVVAGQASDAARLHSHLVQFPLLLTRDLAHAKRLIREYAGEASHHGLLASSGAMRLRADGIELKRELRNAINYPDWFLRSAGDIRSSNQLEVAATEFECQGLELDWTLVCWGGDFIRAPADSDWCFRRLIGPRWAAQRDATEQEFIRNKYRVLLTRARFGTVLYVPRGDAADPTRGPAEFDRVQTYLEACGLSVSLP